MKRLVVGTLGLLLIAGGASLAQSDQPSLAELAKQTKSAKKVCKTLTNDDVATAPSTDSGTPVASSRPVSLSEEPSAKPEGKKDASANSAAASKDAPAVAELKRALATYKEEQDGWKRSAKRYEDLLANETSDFRRQMYQDALDSDKHNVALFQEKIDHTQSELAKAQKETGAGSGAQP